MSYGKIDIEDAVLGGVFTLASLATTGLFVGGTFQPVDIQLTESVWSSGSTTITIAFIVSLAAIAGAYVTNRVGKTGRSNTVSVDTDLNDIVGGKASVETYVAGATLVIVLLNGFNVLGFNGFLTSNWWAGVIAFGVQLGGYYVFSWMG